MRILMSVTTWDGARIEAGLRDYGIMTTVAKDGVEVFECMDLLNHPVVLLETDLPDMRWKIALQQLRREQPDMSILVIDNRCQVDDALAAFENGADDVLDPRMQADEIVSRILAVAARRAGHAGPVLRMGPLKVDLRLRRAYWGPERIDLSPSQYEILEMLAMNRLGAVTKDQIMGQLYGVDEGPDPRVIDVFICKIRASLQAAGAADNIIQTMRGRGFSLHVDARDEIDMPIPFSDKVVSLDVRRAA